MDPGAYAEAETACFHLCQEDVVVEFVKSHGEIEIHAVDCVVQILYEGPDGSVVGCVALRVFLVKCCEEDKREYAGSVVSSEERMSLTEPIRSMIIPTSGEDDITVDVMHELLLLAQAPNYIVHSGETLIQPALHSLFT